MQWLGAMPETSHGSSSASLQLPESLESEIRLAISGLTTSRSSRPAIYGVVAAAEVSRLRPLSEEGAQDEVTTLEYSRGCPEA